MHEVIGWGGSVLHPQQVTWDEVYVGRGGKLDWERLEVSGWGRAHHSYEIPAAVLAHQLLLAVATLDDTSQPPIEHDVGAVGAVALPGVGVGVGVGGAGQTG